MDVAAQGRVDYRRRSRPAAEPIGADIAPPRRSPTMTVPQPGPASFAGPRRYQFVCDADTASRMEGGAWALTYRRVVWIAPIVIAVTLYSVAFIKALTKVGTTEGFDWSSLLGLAAVWAFFQVLLLVLGIKIASNGRRTIRAFYPAGAVYDIAISGPNVRITSTVGRQYNWQAHTREFSQFGSLYRVSGKDGSTLIPLDMLTDETRTMLARNT